MKVNNVFNDQKQSRSLYQITAEVEEAIKILETYCLDNDTDEIPEELFERLNINKDEMADKLYKYYIVQEELKAKQDTIQKEIERLHYKQTRLQVNIDNLKRLSVEAINNYGDDVIGKDKLPTGNKRFKNDFISLSLVYTKSIEGDIKAVDEPFIKQTLTINNLSSLDITAINDFLNERKNRIAETVYELKHTEKLNKTKVKKVIAQTGEIPNGITVKKNPSLRVR